MSCSFEGDSEFGRQEVLGGCEAKQREREEHLAIYLGFEEEAVSRWEDPKV